jgi:cytochrome c556
VRLVFAPVLPPSRAANHRSTAVEGTSPEREGENHMIRSVLAATALIGGVTVLLAQSDPIAERKQLMKSNASQSKNVSQMVKGEAPFDAAKADAAFRTWGENAQKLPALFASPPPPGADTRALPKIWQNKADFDAKHDAFVKAVAAGKGKTKSVDELKAALPAVSKACGDCHEPYRAAAKKK